MSRLAKTSMLRNVLAASIVVCSTSAMAMDNTDYVDCAAILRVEALRVDDTDSRKTLNRMSVVYAAQMIENLGLSSDIGLRMVVKRMRVHEEYDIDPTGSKYVECISYFYDK